jgi:hypothetical protein
MLELKTYLRERGVSVNGYLKPALVNIAIAVEKMMLPVDPNFEKEKGSQDIHKLIIHDMEIPDPFGSSYNLVNNFGDSPPFGLYDIFNYLINHFADYDKQGLAAYKAFDEYRLFQDGYVESLLTQTILDVGVHLYVGKVKPAMKVKTDEGKPFYDLWFILEGKGANRGSVIAARCRCIGGRDGGCKHIAAAMYSLDDLLNTHDKDSVTSMPCVWVKKPTTDSKPCDVKDLPIKKEELPLHGKKNGHIYCEHIDIDVRHGEDQKPPTKKSTVKFTEALEDCGQRPTILPLLVKSYDLQAVLKAKFCKQHAPDGAKESNNHGIVEENLVKMCNKGDEVQKNSIIML